MEVTFLGTGTGIHATYPLEEARAAQEALSARAVIGKAVLVA